MNRKRKKNSNCVILLNKGKQGLAKAGYGAHERIHILSEINVVKCLILEEISNLKIHVDVNIGGSWVKVAQGLLSISLHLPVSL